MLHGESAPRLAFLRQILEAGPAAGLNPTEGVLRMHPCAGQAHDYYLIYPGVSQPALLEITLPEGEEYRAQVVDTWDMTVTPSQETYSGRVDIPLPGKAYHALILRRVR